jgi:hypothetical protein
MRQIDLFCAPLQMSTKKVLADHNGGSVRAAPDED